MQSSKLLYQLAQSQSNLLGHFQCEHTSIKKEIDKILLIISKFKACLPIMVDIHQLKPSLKPSININNLEVQVSHAALDIHPVV
jgi:hypothetical protein